MASIFKRRRLKPIPDNADIRSTKKGRTAAWTDARGRRQSRPVNDAGDKIVVEDERYTIVYVDHTGKRRTVTGASDKTATGEIANKLEGDVMLRRRGVIDARAETIADESKKPIEKHLADYRAKMVAANRSDKHIEETLSIIDKMVEDCGFATVAEINPDAVNHYATRCKDQNLASRTIQWHLGTIGAVTRWLVRTGKLASDPLVTVEKPNPQADRRRERRFLLPDEYPYLERAMRTGPDRYDTPAIERMLLYDTAIQTGLRSGEMRSLTRGKFHLSKGPYYVICRAGSTKNKKDARQYITADLAARIKKHLRSKTPNAPAFRMPRDTVMAEMIRQDMDAARTAWLAEVADNPQLYAERENSDFLASLDSEGRLFDFHTLRHTCASWLALKGAHPKAIQSVMRHSSIVLTMDMYGHLIPGQEAETIELFNDFMVSRKIG